MLAGKPCILLSSVKIGRLFKIAQIYVQNCSLRWIIICGAMLLIAFLFGSVPLFISYCNIMDR